MAPDCNFNTMGPANNTVQGFFITNFITFMFLFCVQLVTSCDQLHDKLCKLFFYTFFNDIFKNILGGLQTVIELYWVACQYKQFYVPEQRVKRNQRRLNQQFIQTAQPTDECIAGL